MAPGPVLAMPRPIPADPLAAFAARAQPGQVEDVSPSPGAAPVTVRLVRAYNAASGRECRELSVGYRAARPALYCDDPATGWGAARALLRGGAVGRP
ncbi:DVU3141 family protein [Pseudoroseomonas globiformis]|uniref:DVU3141 family protein n=1 Tax=Teichococcus globiformis TaxID=2307229 RepID=A0ABV7FYA3_9PROT